MNQSASLQRQLYGIGIFEEEIILSDFTDGPEKRFVVSTEQLMDFFRSEVVFRPFPGLVWMKSDGTGETYLVTLPATERTILYNSGRKKKRKDRSNLTDYRLRLPAIAVKAQVDTASRKITSISMWGFAGRELTRETVLYELPLPNLNGSSLCLGSTERAANGTDLRGAIERVIFDTPFNHHSHLVGKAKIPFQDYVAKYKGRTPLATLPKLGTGRQILGAS